MEPLVWYEVGNQLSARIIQAARDVFDCLGPSCSDKEYRKAMVNLLERQNLDVQQRFPVDVWQANELAQLYFLDLWVEWQVIVNIQASRRPISSIEREDMIEHLEAAGAPLGVLLNFGRHGLEYERVFL